MACTETIKMRDRNAGQTKQVDRCWIVPAKFSIEVGARFDPVALGWQEDVNCINFNSASTDCSSCSGGDSSQPVRYSATQLLKRTDGSFQLATNYAKSSDSLVYRLSLTATPTVTIWSAQTTGGTKTFSIDYAFASGTTYTLTVERVGKSSSQVTESDLVLTVGGSGSTTDDLFVEVNADDMGDGSGTGGGTGGTGIETPTTSLPAFQNKLFKPTESRDTAMMNIGARLDSTNGLVYLLDEANPDRLGRGSEYEWRYFVDDQWLTRAQFLSMPRARNFPVLVVKILTNVSLPVGRWRDQTVLAYEDQTFLRLY